MRHGHGLHRRQLEGQLRQRRRAWPCRRGGRSTSASDNYTRAFTDSSVSGPFLGILGWNFAFAILTVVTTFAAGLLVAIALNSPRLRALRFYRLLIVLPYAMPSFAMLLVWRDMFNTDFGLINNLTGRPSTGSGTCGRARFAVLLVQFWLGYPYMFLVCLGALQSIPADMTEAAAVDGARPFQAFRAVVFPLLLVAVAPLLIASFAFNFNNFNVIQLTTAGAPFPPDNVEGGRHRPARELYVPARVHRGRRPVRVRRRDLGPDLRDRGRVLDHRVPAHRRPRGDQPMTGQNWFFAVGWRHLVAIGAIIFALIPILFVASAAFNPLGTLSSTDLIPSSSGSRTSRTCSRGRTSPGGSSTRS